MRIAYISPSFPPDLGWDAGANRVYEYALGMRDAGHSVDVFSLASEISAVTRQDGFTVHRLLVDQRLTKLRMVPRTTPHLITLMSSRNGLWKSFLTEHARNPFDVVDAPGNMWDGLVPGLPGLLPLVIREQPQMSTYDKSCFSAASAFALNQQLMESMAHSAYKFAEAVYSQDEQSAQALSAKCGRNVDVVAEPINLARFTADGAIAFAKDKDHKIIILARVQSEKIAQLIKDVALAVHEQSPESQFLVLAEDITSDDDEWHVQDSFKGLLKEPAQILVSRAYHELLPELLRSAPIVFVAPDSERLPSTWLETLACSRALIASQHELCAHYLLDQKDALIVPAFDAQAAAKAIMKLKEDAALRSALAAAGVIKVRENFASDTIVKILEKLYTSSIQSFATHERKAARALAMCDLIDRSEDLVTAYDGMLYDFLFSESKSFRVKHWLGKMSGILPFVPATPRRH